MKRYELLESNMHHCEEMLENTYGDWVKFDDAQAELAKKDAEIAELKAMLSIACTALLIANDWNLNEVQLDPQQAELITQFAATDPEDDEHPHSEGWVRTYGICEAINAAIAAEEQAK